jgi:iron complex outermembrane recepter protein
MHRMVVYCFSAGIYLTFGAHVWALDSETKDKGGPSITLGEAVVTTTRDTAESVGKLPLASEQRKVDASDRARTSDTASLLDGEPGVSLQQNGGVSSFPFIRGLGDDRLRIRVDGMDLIAACPNHMNSPLSYIDPTNVRRMDVIAGITPVSLGGDSIGGTILVESIVPGFAKPGQGVLFHGQAGAYYRTNGNAVGAHLSASAAGEHVSVQYAGSFAQADNYRAARDFKPAGLAAVDRGFLRGDEVGSSRYRAWNHAGTLALGGQEHAFQLTFGLQHIPYEGFPNQRMDMTDNYSEQFNGYYKGEYRWGTLEARIYHEQTWHKMDFADDKQFFYGSAATILAPGMPMETRAKNTGASIKGDIELSERNNLRVGLEGQIYRLDDWWPPSPPVLPPGYTSGGMAPDTFISINNGKRDRLDLFAEWEARWTPQWMTQFGARDGMVRMDTGTVHGYNDTMMYNGAPQFPATTFNNRSRLRTDNNIDLTALTRYTPVKTLDFEIGYARKNRSPSLYERYAWSINTMAMEMINFTGDGNFYVGNLNLKPESANILSATVDWHDPEREKWGLKFTPYYTYVQDYIDARRCPAGSVCSDTAAVRTSLTSTNSFVYLQFINQAAELYGIDVSGYFPLAATDSYGSFSVRGTASYVKGTNRKTGDNLYNIMPPNARVALVHSLGKLTNTIEGQFVDAKTDVSEVRNELKTAGYGLLNLRSSYEWKNLRIDGGVDNVLDKFYALPLGGAYVGQGATMSANVIPWGIRIPGPGRSFYAALTVKY